jgi:hypothetical protein
MPFHAEDKASENLSDNREKTVEKESHHHGKILVNGGLLLEKIRCIVFSKMLLKLTVLQ